MMRGGLQLGRWLSPLLQVLLVCALVLMNSLDDSRCFRCAARTAPTGAPGSPEDNDDTNTDQEACLSSPHTPPGASRLPARRPLFMLAGGLMDLAISSLLPSHPTARAALRGPAERHALVLPLRC